MKTAVVYWSGTGHTEAMAQAVAGAAGADVFTASDNIVVRLKPIAD